MKNIIVIAILGFLLNIQGYAQLYGVVCDNDGPLVGVVVENHAQMHRVTTDFKGSYSIPANIGDVITYKFLGKRTHTLIYSPDVSGDVVMKDDVYKLEDVVCVAFGEQKKSTVVGSFDYIKGEELQKIGRTSSYSVIEDMLNFTSGVYGTKGDDGIFHGIIRGKCTVSSETSPLVIVDGHAYQGVPSEIQIDDVESVSVLKDASSCALYGANGANGAILIKLKDVKKIGNRLRVSLDHGWKFHGPTYDVIRDVKTYDELMYLSLYNKYVERGLSQDISHTYALSEMDKMYTGVHNDNGDIIDIHSQKVSQDASEGQYVDGMWLYPQKDDYDIYRVGKYTKGVIDWSNDHVYVQGVLNKNEHSLKDSYKNMRMAQMRSSHDFLNLIHLGTQLRYSYHETGNKSYDDLLGYTIAPCTMALFNRDENGNIVSDDKYTSQHNGLLNNQTNYALLSDIQKNDKMIDRNMYGLYELGFKKGGFSISSSGAINMDFLIDDHYVYSSMQPIYYKTFQNNINKSHYVVLGYKRALGNHVLDFTLGYNQVKNTYDYWSYTYNYDYMNGQVGMPKRYSYGHVSTSHLNFVSRLTYSHNGLWSVEGSFDRTGSSLLCDNKYGTFYSVGMVANIKDILHLQGIDGLKVSYAHGTAGNDVLDGKDTYKDTYRIENGNISLEAKGSINLKWENTTSDNLNVTASKWGFELSVDIYRKQVDGMLFDKLTAPSNGYLTIPVNFGVIRNVGIDLSLGYINTIGDISWYGKLTASGYRNKLVKLPEGVEYYQGLLQQGKSMNRINLYKEEVRKGEQYEIVNSSDMTPLAKGNLNVGFAYKGFSCNVVTKYQIGGRILDMVYGSLMHQNVGNYGWHKDILKHKDTLSDNYNYTSYKQSNVFNASFLSIEGISLQYKICDFLKCKEVMFGVNLQDIYIKSAKRGLDPRFCEIVNDSVHNSQKTFLMSINCLI